MKIANLSLSKLADMVCGNHHLFPYLSGAELVKFFNNFGSSDLYDDMFPARFTYTEHKLIELNGSEYLKEVIEETLDPRRFISNGFDVDKAATYVNSYLIFDKFELIKVGGFYKVRNNKHSTVEPVSTKSIDHNFIMEQIEKCQKKISEHDYNGAITNARSLLEAIFIEIIEKHEGKEMNNDGKIDNLWSKVKKILKLQIDRATMPEFVISILSGLETTIKGLSGLSNNAGDRHANKFVTKAHHAKLAVNCVMTLSDFLVDVRSYQEEK